MASQVVPAAGPSADTERAGGLRFLARQPILDLKGQVHAYELLFRNGLENAFRGADLETASRTIVDNAVMFGLEELTGGNLAFVNCTAEVLTGELASLLPPSLAVLEILETVEPSTELVAAIKKFKAQGFRIALDDFLWSAKMAPFIELADYIKIDVLRSSPQELRDLIHQIPANRAALVAEKVETAEDYKRVCAEGFKLFQGYYFCRPVMMEKRKIPSNTLFHLEIMQQLLADPLDLKKLAPLVKSDAGITYRLLRLVNSAGYGVRLEVRSIQAALVMVGDDTFRRIAMLAIATELSAGRPAELLRMAFIRARFCELAAVLCRLDPTEQYLLGMLSLFPAMLQVPIEHIVPTLPLRAQICESLQGACNPERRLLTWLEAHERGDWRASDEAAQATGLDGEQLYECYADAVPWAWSTLRSAS
jgi:c-di-GMP-related signal transduction protein